MDVLFQPNRGKPFYIEVGYFDTVLEIKEKIQKDQGIPISTQTLIFNGNILQNELNVHHSEILDRSRIQLLVTADPSMKKDECLSCNIKLVLRMPASSKVGIVVEMNYGETIRGVKEKIHEMEGIPISRLVIHAANGGIELHDHRSLQECELTDNSELEVVVQSSPTATTSSGSSGNYMISGSRGKLRIFVVTKCGTKKIPLEVNFSDSVGELRKKLQKLNEELEFDLPTEGYFFIYKQNVMDDDRSFRWHHVGQGDTIEIFNGSVSGGS